MGMVDLREEILRLRAQTQRERDARAQGESSGGPRFDALTTGEISLLLRTREEQGFAKGQELGYQQGRATVEQEIVRAERTVALLTAQVLAGEVVPVLDQVSRAADASVKAPQARTTRAAVEKAGAMARELGPRLPKLISDLADRGLLP
jgi:hypothetical protein